MKLYFVAFLFLVASCSPSYNHKSSKSVSKNELKYAKGFALEHRNGKTYIDVYNPWNNYSVLASYELSPCIDTSSNRKSEICVPIKQTACLSSTYLGMISLLNAHNTVVASSNANWICDSILYNNFLDGKIKNLGNDMAIGAEAVIASDPDVVLKYIYQSPDPIDPVIQNAGIPLVYIIEFMEEHPLGRAEWIKLVGALLDKEEQADSIFSVIETNYHKFARIAQASMKKPKVLCGSIYKGTWYAVGGESFMAKLLRDANADYYWSSDSTTGSLPLSFESVIYNQSDADYWVNANASSIEELLAIEPRNEIFNALKEGNVFHYNKRMNENGGLDFYETGVVRPDLLLRDLLVILHPDLIEAETVYYRKLK